MYEALVVSFLDHMFNIPLTFSFPGKFQTEAVFEWTSRPNTLLEFCQKGIGKASIIAFRIWNSPKWDIFPNTTSWLIFLLIVCCLFGLDRNLDLPISRDAQACTHNNHKVLRHLSKTPYIHHMNTFPDWFPANLYPYCWSWLRSTMMIQREDFCIQKLLYSLYYTEPP